MEITFTVTKEQDGMSAESILRKKYLMSSNMIKKVKLYGRLEADGVHIRIRDAVHEGNVIFASYEEDSGKLKENSQIPILYEDDWIGVVCKPSNMVTHPTHGHLDDSLLTALSDNTLHPVMRLDRDTSGLLVVAKNGYAHNTVLLGGITKKYIAAVYGEYNPSEGVINLPIKRREGSVMIRDVSPDGKESITYYKSLYYNPDTNLSLVGFVLGTGRCHQIRVHSTYMGHPLAGDTLYGPNSIDNPSDKFPESAELDKVVGRQALHAAILEIINPKTCERMHFEYPIPSDIRKLFPELSDEACNELLGKLNGFSAGDSGEKS